MRTFKHKMTNNAIMRTICYGCVFLLFAGSCTNDNTMADDKENNTGVPAGATPFIGSSLPEVATRTAILNHTKAGGAAVNWSNNDKIWVKDDAGQWKQSLSVTFPAATNKARGQFALTGTYTGSTHDVVYTNTAITGSQTQVDIKAAQTQTAPNNFDHAGEAGDCGIATASKTSEGYAFTLSHKASYICLIPRTSNAFVKRSKLIKVEIIADNNISGRYNMAADGTLSLASNGSNTITVTTGSGFALDNEADDMGKNATYAVVAPGKHSFRIRYWLSNATDNYDGTIEGTVTKYVTLDCKPGTIHDITANLDPQDYAGLYYLWDAKENFWFGHEWNSASPLQPTKPYGDIEEQYYFGNDDPRSMNISSRTAVNSCAKMPNANEMSWYAMKGDPHWDADELWSTMGHLYKGGMWFKKKAVLLKENNYSTEISADRTTDLRTTNKQMTNNQITMGVPSPADYFYLPALGYYDGSLLGVLAEDGLYWSSTTFIGGESYYMDFSKSSIDIASDIHIYAMPVMEFK